MSPKFRTLSISAIILITATALAAAQTTSQEARLVTTDDTTTASLSQTPSNPAPQGSDQTAASRRLSDDPQIKGFDLSASGTSEVDWDSTQSR